VPMFKMRAHSVAASSVRPEESVALRTMRVLLFRFERLFDRDPLPFSEPLHACLKDLWLVRDAWLRLLHGLTDSTYDSLSSSESLFLARIDVFRSAEWSRLLFDTRKITFVPTSYLAPPREGPRG
jgi:hypothetical protein